MSKIKRTTQAAPERGMMETVVVTPEDAFNCVICGTQHYIGNQGECGRILNGRIQELEAAIANSVSCPRIPEEDRLKWPDVDGHFVVKIPYQEIDTISGKCQSRLRLDLAKIDRGEMWTSYYHAAPVVIKLFTKADINTLGVRFLAGPLDLICVKGE